MEANGIGCLDGMDACMTGKGRTGGGGNGRVAQNFMDMYKQFGRSWEGGKRYLGRSGAAMDKWIELSRVNGVDM